MGVTEREILDLLSRHYALTTRQIAERLNVNYIWIRYRLSRLLEKGLIGKIETEELIPPARKAFKVIYWCKRENFNRVLKWLGRYSNIKVKRKLLLPKHLSSVFSRKRK